MFKFILRDDGWLSKAHIAKHSSPTPLVHVITSRVVNCAPSVSILSQFPSGSKSVNLAFQLSDKTLKSSYKFYEFTSGWHFQKILWISLFQILVRILVFAYFHQKMSIKRGSGRGSSRGSVFFWKPWPPYYTSKKLVYFLSTKIW